MKPEKNNHSNKIISNGTVLTNDTRSSVWIQYFVAPIIVGLIMLFGQSVVQPLVTEKIHIDTERWNEKRDVFTKVLVVVDKQFSAHPFKIGTDGPNRSIQYGPEPEPEEINSAFNNLVLVVDDRQIVDAFNGCFGRRKGQKIVRHEEKLKLLNLMRKELNFGPADLKSDDVYFVQKSMPQSNISLYGYSNR